jgi:hypothetical protein
MIANQTQQPQSIITYQMKQTKETSIAKSTSSNLDQLTTTLDQYTPSTSSINETKGHDPNAKNNEPAKSIRTLDTSAENKVTRNLSQLPSENDSNASTKLKIKDNPDKTSQEQITHDSVTNKVEDKTITKVKSPNSDNQPAILLYGRLIRQLFVWGSGW